MKEILDRLLNHEELTREETKNILLGITRSEYTIEQISALLTALQMRGISVEERHTGNRSTRAPAMRQVYRRGGYWR